MKPSNELTPGDAAWLFTKVLLFLFLSGTAIMCVVATGIFVGVDAYLSTNSHTIGVACAFCVWLAGMAGREWFHVLLARLFFSISDEKEIDRVSRGE